MSLDKTITIKQQQQVKSMGGYKKRLEVCMHTRPTWGLAALITTLVIIVASTVVVWTTDLIKIALDKNIGIENNSMTYHIWEKPPIYPLVGVYVFNYTNAEAFEKGIDKKLKVEEVGPYVYKEVTEKVNIVFNNNGTVSYQQKSSFSFVPELSHGHLPRQERIVVPNIPLLSAMSAVKDTYMLAQLAFLAVCRGLETKQFVHIAAHDFFWGYDDPLFSAARTYGSFTQELPYKKFGILAQRNGVFKNRVTMYTGKQDARRMGVVSMYNGQDRLHHWTGEECNRIDGTDGSMFPPHLVKRNSTLYIFQGDMCRRMPLQYTEDVITRGNIPALRFKLPPDVFANPDVNPENACYCHPDVEACPPSGVFNASPCAYGAPVMMSFPHFYNGDPVLREAVEGLKPDPVRHTGYIDMHQQLGVALDAKSRLQMNMMVRKSPTLDQLADFKDGTILPIAWFDVGIDNLPEEVMSLVYHVTFTTRRVQFILQYVLLVLSVGLLYLLVRRIRCRHAPAAAPPDPSVVMHM